MRSAFCAPGAWGAELISNYPFTSPLVSSCTVYNYLEERKSFAGAVPTWLGLIASTSHRSPVEKGKSVPLNYVLTVAQEKLLSIHQCKQLILLSNGSAYCIDSESSVCGKIYSSVHGCIESNEQSAARPLHKHFPADNALSFTPAN